MNAFSRPDTIPVDFAGFPLALAPLIAERRWVVWRWEPDRNGRPTKVPYQPDFPVAKAASNRAETWGDHATAVGVVTSGEADGIGFMLAGSRLGVFDIDDCRDAASGQVEAWAWHIIDEAHSYTEVTIRGGGLRVIGLGAGSKVHRKQRVPGTSGSVETYRGAERFIVMTGAVLPGFSDKLLDIDGVIDGTVARLDDAARAERESKKTERNGFDFSGAREQPGSFRDAFTQELPAGLELLIRNGAPEGQRSDQFFHVVGWLKDLGKTTAEIEAILARCPDGIAAKYAGRLQQEIERAYDRAESRSQQDSRTERGRTENRSQADQGEPKDSPFALKWHGEQDDTPLKEWLVDKTLPKTGTALLSGQWGTYKTFVGFDLSGAIITRTPFAGRPVARQGGVLWIAVEGQDEVRIRLEAIVEEKVRPALAAGHDMLAVDPDHMPFVWAEACPKLTAEDALPKLRQLVAAAAAGLRERHNLPLALILIDTLSPAAEFKDANDTAENQRVMTVLKTVAREFQCLLIAVDHFGKDSSTGTRNSSVKEADVDAVLALLGDKDLAGNVANPRMAIRKVRGAPTGAEIRFEKRIVHVVANGEDEAHTTLVIDWARAEGETQAAREKRWPKSLSIFKRSLDNALEKGAKVRPFADNLEVLAVDRDIVRDEFLKQYPADDLKTKGQAFRRCEREAIAAAMMTSREVAGRTLFWLR